MTCNTNREKKKDEEEAKKHKEEEKALCRGLEQFDRRFDFLSTVSVRRGLSYSLDGRNWNGRKLQRRVKSKVCAKCLLVKT